MQSVYEYFRVYRRCRCLYDKAKWGLGARLGFPHKRGTLRFLVICYTGSHDKCNNSLHPYSLMATQHAGLGQLTNNSRKLPAGSSLTQHISLVANLAAVVAWA